MVLGIEASNILAGGGLVHLKELLCNAQPLQYGFTKVIVWAPASTLNQLADQDWLIKKTHSCLNRNMLFRMVWQLFIMPRCARSIDVLFVPGANPVRFSKTVSMCQNLLPFDDQERKLYGFSWMNFRLLLLRFSQIHSFKKARRVIFLTPSSIQYVSHQYPNIESKAIVISHGINNDIRHYSSVREEHQTIKLLYTSIVDVYKHQWNVVNAVFNLLDKGYPVALKLVGSSYKPAMDKLNQVLRSRPQYADKITYVPLVPHGTLPKIYQETDIFVFASSCETFSLILLEAMASGLAIACSDRNTLRDTLGDAGLYFDPYHTKDIERALLTLIEHKPLREKLRKRAYEISSSYSWSTCADRTFQCLAEVGREQ